MSDEIITGAELSRRCGVSRAAVTMAEKRGLLIKDPDGHYDMSHPDNLAYFLNKMDGLKPEEKKKAEQQKKIPLKKTDKTRYKTDVEIFLEALGKALSDSVISASDQSILKKLMITHAEKIEKDQIRNFKSLPDDKKSATKKTADALKIISKFEGDLFPCLGESVFFITTAQLNVAAFLIYASERFGKIEEIIMSYFRVSKQTIEIIDNLFKNNLLGKIYLMISELSTHDSSPSMLHIVDLCKKYPKKVAGGTAQTHTKMLLFKINENYYCVSGSANMTRNNARIEQYQINNDKNLYEFNREWILSPEVILGQHDSEFFGDRTIFL